MFTGIIEELGKIKSIYHFGNYAKITISCKKVLEGSKLGDSIAVNGICLTATEITDSSFSADVMHETLNRTAFADFKMGTNVNLERAMAANGRFGGHIVSGHIDGTGKVESLKNDGNAVWFKIAIPNEMRKYVIEKGSIAIDGISLTVADVSPSTNNPWFQVSIIPHTLQETALAYKKPGDKVNLENDVIGKYIENLMRFGNSDLTAEENTESSNEKRLEELLANF